MTIFSTASLADPPPTSAIAAAAAWLQATALGTIAHMIAIIAVAAIGYLMMTGRVNVRRSSTVLVGIFIVFGASSIVDGLRSMATGSSIDKPAERPPSDPPRPLHSPKRNPNYDPYAGASIQYQQP